MKFFARLAAIAALAALGGCANYTLVEANKSVAVGNGISVTPKTQWNQFKGDHMTWTTQGPAVDTLHFVTGVKSGNPVFKIFGVDSKSLAQFDSNMLPNDIQDLIVTSLTRQGYKNVRPGALAPCPFGAQTGFCFDLNFITGDGLEMKGMVMARKQGDMLDAFLFLAPNEHYFADLQPAVKDVFASVQAK